MKVYCYICTANHREPPNYREVPDDAVLSPGFQFMCRQCAGQSEKPAAPHGEKRGGNHPHDGGDSPTTTEEFLPQIKTIARAFAEVYGLNVKDCIQEGALALWNEEVKGKTLTTREVYGCVRRSMFRFAKRERAKRGQVRQVDPETDPILDPPEKQLLRYTRIDPKTGERTECEEWREGKSEGKKKVGEPHFQRLAFDAELNAGTDKEVIPLRGATGAIADSPEEQAIARQRKHLLKLARRELTPIQREVLYLLYDEDLSIREAATFLGMSKSEVWRISTEATAAIARKLGTKPNITPIGISRDAVRQSEQKLAA